MVRRSVTPPRQPQRTSQKRHSAIRRLSSTPVGKATLEEQHAEKAESLFNAAMNLVRAEWRRVNGADLRRKGVDERRVMLNPVNVLKAMPAGPDRDRIVNTLTLLAKDYAQTPSGEKATIIVGSL